MIGCLYRQAAPGEVDTIHSYKREGQLRAANAVGCVMLGDLNVHHRKWLKYSNRNSLEGQELSTVCKDLGLTQLVRELCRGGGGGGVSPTLCFPASLG